MKANTLIGLLLGTLGSAFSSADFITSWGAGTQGQEYDISQIAQTITILKGDGNVYKFFSETSNGSGVPGVINNVTVDSGASGNFTIWIQDDSTPNGAPGASDVKQMNLSYGGGTSTVYVLWTSADLGEDDDVTIENLNGPILAGGDSQNTLTVGTWDTRANITAVNVVGTVVINDDMTGSIDIGDTLSGTVNANAVLSSTRRPGMLATIAVAGRHRA
jgi:hypothetical protein